MEPVVDELLHRHHRGALDLDAVEILVGQQQVLVLLELVAFDEIAALQLLPGLGILRDHPDPVAGLRIDHVEPDVRAVVPGVEERHGAGHEREAEMTTPDRSGCHYAALSGSPGRPFPLGLAGLFGVGLVVIGGVLDGGQMVRQRVFEFGQRVLHARPRA